ncbi:enoyl-CoA hydratase [Arthrobacter glacialis]|uniref:Probable enoyl-CoA hydratase echA8 n=1 Tax=Arthrobacter glacialis TaxID=1664 RepID=A0A2S3ZZN5_ARTGL|nr:enoyl-CoA hydratase [Arthrobacter glacialis]POH74678.1 enoyl-CoA hydratase [Arthrobacter glacialis]
MTQHSLILTEQHGRVGLIMLNRPEALNALSDAMGHEILAAARAFDADPGIGAMVITGSSRAFAAGADIKEMAEKSSVEMYQSNWFSVWDELARVRTPMIAAVAGHALGGGCELAMIADFIIAADNAKFGQPEIKLGVIPGMGGSQRLTRAIGKAKAMEMVLTGRVMGAVEAEQAGLVARVVPVDSLLEDALATAAVIAGMSKPVAMIAKEAVNAAFETTLAEGVVRERRGIYACFATEDQKEGMAAFTEKRAAEFKHR